MNKIDISKVFKSFGEAAKKHSPEILTGLGIAGMLSTTILAVKATPKALILIENRKRDIRFESIRDKNTPPQSDKLTPIETIKTVWKCYIPATATCVCSIACLVGASSVSARRNAALAAAYTLSESAFSDYKEKVVKTLGEKKEEAVRDAVAKDKVDKNPVEANDVVLTQRGETLCYDALSGRYFKSDIEQIRKAVNELNHQLLLDTYVSLNDLYDILGLDQIPIGDSLEWMVDSESSDKGLIELRFSSQLASDGTPCVVLDFINPPTYQL